MRPRREPVPRARSASHWLAGILLLGILGGGTTVAAILLWENLDVRQLAPGLAGNLPPLPDPEPPAPPGAGIVPYSVALFASARNQAFFPDTAYYPRALARWRGLLEGVGGEVRIVRSLEDLSAVGRDELLIIPDAPCLSRAEMARVRAHLERGGNLLSNWAVGARDEGCEWRGWQRVRDLTGAGDVRELARREALFLTVPSGTPFSPGLDPGTRIELRPEPSLALVLPGPRVYWSDWALNPAADESGGGAFVATAASRTEQGGRVVWYGFRLSQAATPQDSLRLERLVKNGALWAAGIPVAAPAPWPNGKRAALLFVQDVESEFGNASALAALLREEEVPGTFFAVSQLATEDTDLGPVLRWAGEVGSHTSDHTPVSGLTFPEQTVRLRRSREEIQDWAGVPPAGLRPPEEVFDVNTLRAWHQAGGGYVLAVNQARSASPELHRSPDYDLVLLPRLIKDDYNVFVQEGAVRAARLTEAFLQGTRKLRSIGGLAVVATHTQIVGSDGRLGAIRSVIDTARAQGDWWIARAEEVADWWKSRSGVQITPLLSQDLGLGYDTEGVPRDSAMTETQLPAGEERVIGGLLVTGPTEGSGLSDLWIEITLPGGPEGVFPLVDDVPVPFVVTGWGVRVPVGDLPSGAEKMITLSRRLAN